MNKTEQIRKLNIQLGELYYQVELLENLDLESNLLSLEQFIQEYSLSLTVLSDQEIDQIIGVLA